VTAAGAFGGTIAGMVAVLTVAFAMPWIEFLWHNVIGAVVVVLVGTTLSLSRSGADSEHETALESSR
jgi:solute:Na+ symporter, SSS family